MVYHGLTMVFFGRVNSGLTGDYSSVKFHWGLTVDQSLAGVGEINLLLTGEVN